MRSAARAAVPHPQTPPHRTRMRWGGALHPTTGGAFFQGKKGRASVVVMVCARTTCSICSKRIEEDATSRASVATAPTRAGGKMLLQNSKSCASTAFARTSPAPPPLRELPLHPLLNVVATCRALMSFAKNATVCANQVLPNIEEGVQGEREETEEEEAEKHKTEEEEEVDEDREPNIEEGVQGEREETEEEEDEEEEGEEERRRRKRRRGLVALDFVA